MGKVEFKACLFLLVFAITAASASYCMDEPQLAKEKKLSPKKQYEEGHKMYRQKQKGKKVNEKQMFELLKSSSDAGYAKANRFLGELYYAGIGTPIDRVKSLEIHRVLAKEGNADSCFRVGAIYYKGWKDEVKIDYDRAFYYMEAAANSYSPSPLALQMLVGMYKGCPDERYRNIAKAEQYLKMCPIVTPSNQKEQLEEVITLFHDKDYKKSSKDKKGRK